MGYYAVVKTDTGSIEKLLFHGDGSNPQLPEGHMAVEVGPELYAHPDSGLLFVEGRVQARAGGQSPEKAWDELRTRRNQMLFQTDWTQLPDVPDEIRAAYVPYRKALRELPASTADPANPTWPEAPAMTRRTT